MPKNTTDLQELIEFNRANEWPDLDAQRQLFCMAYMEAYSLSGACSAAKIEPGTGRTWLREPLVLAFIGDLQAHLDSRTVISKDFVHLQWLKVLPKLMGEESVPMIDRAGREYDARRFHAAESVALIKELGKIAGVYDNHNTGDEADAPPLNISFNVADAVSDVKVTRGKKRES
jgi:hypothetical protein